MELRQLRYFVTVANQLNFREAADLLYVTQPTLSKQIADLEYELGQQLFIRSTRQVQLTEAGAALLKDAKELLHQADKITGNLRSAVKTPSVEGTLKIGIEDGYDRLTLIAAIGQLVEKFPAINIEIHDFSANHGIQMLQSNQIDCAFVLFPDKIFPDNIICQVMQLDQLSLIAPQGSIATQTLDEYLQRATHNGVCLLSNNNKGINLIGKLFHSWNISPEFTFIENMRSLLFFVESGNGIGVVPRTVYEAYNSPYLSAYHVLPQTASLCTICAWNELNNNPLRDLLLDEFPSVSVLCKECPNTWCKYH